MEQHPYTIIKRPTTLILLWGLVLEFPVRYWVAPDPWVHGADHWYFAQPNRLFIEIGFALLAILPFFWVKELKSLLTIQWTKGNVMFLTLGMLGATLIFTMQQSEEITTIQQSGLGRYIPIWFSTGMAIGIGQELTFRGLIYTGLEKPYGTTLAILLSTLCFALGSIHSVRMYVYLINDYVFETLLLLSIFILTGLFFAWVRAKTNNIIIPALIHGVGNAITWYTFVIMKLYVG
ncbi:CPBP family intramembrane glutamic endopeptidase [Flagellimonas meishanensis]|uniref:CPBP family intramembrane glutamic endopeptidase n=1 Tax=Flagellimonas meishanensis TaxID=2873264 RepID=UPI001CA66F5D|nr:CPBP family intramembrane glutamic endopeptidase [[Muricauda] meishanensis]